MNTLRPADTLVAELRDGLGADRVITEPAQRELYSTDFYLRGAVGAAVIRPADTDSLAVAARTITASGYALVPRGGGMSYTGGYTPDTESSVIVDLSDMTGIVDLDPQNMTLTVRAGTTWATIY